jgi:tRNA-specific 2-thiouridylase
MGFALAESDDKEKDQSYFLSQLTQNELSKILFPIGHFQKSQVRKIAAENNLPVATRKDSQGICFVGDLPMHEFLKKELHPESGNVLNEKGEEIGTHEGAILYTIGQRHGFKVTKKTDYQEHLYVVSKDLDKNTITVSEKLKKDNSESKNSEIFIRNFSFTNNLDDIKNASELCMRIRYRGDKYEIEFISFDEKEKTLKVSCTMELEYAHGQFAVLYDGEKCLGAGEL